MKLSFTGKLPTGLLKNSVVLVLGTGLSQAIPLLFSPWLGRIYNPDAFGHFAVFTAITAIATMASTGLYELAIMLPKYDRQAFNLLGLIMILTTIFTACACFVIALLWQFQISFLGKITLNTLFIPAGIFFNSMFQALNYWLNRKRKYAMLNVVRILQSLGTVGISLILGYLGFKASGLILGYVAGGFMAIIPLLFLLKKNYGAFSWTEMKKIGSQYSNYPKWMLPTSAMNTAAGQVPVFVINKAFDAGSAGNFAMASRILTAPVAIISTAIGQVFYKNLADIINHGVNRLRSEFSKTALLLVIASFVFFFPLQQFGKEIFILVFGSQWADAGRFIEIIVFGTAVKFVVSPLSTVFYATGNLKLLAFWQTTYFISTLSIFLFLSGWGLTTLLWIYAAHEALLYGFYLALMIFAVLKHERKNTIVA